MITSTTVNNETEPFNVLIVDDHEIYRDGLANLIKGFFKFVSVFHANNCDEAIRIANKTPINLVILDVLFDEQPIGLEFLTKLKQEIEELCVVMTSGENNKEWVFESLRKGAMGFLPKSLKGEEQVAALNNILSGRPYIPSFVIGNTDVINLEEKKNLLENLTRTELKVLTYFVHYDGSFDKYIEDTGSSIHTVSNHIKNILDKFKVRTRVELIIKIYKLGIVLGKLEAKNKK